MDTQTVVGSNRTFGLRQLLLLTFLVAILAALMVPPYAIYIVFLMLSFPLLFIVVKRKKNKLLLAVALICFCIALSGPVAGYSRVRGVSFGFLAAPGWAIGRFVPNGFQRWYMDEWQHEWERLGFKGSTTTITGPDLPRNVTLPGIKKHD